MILKPLLKPSTNLPSTNEALVGLSGKSVTWDSKVFTSISDSGVRVEKPHFSNGKSFLSGILHSVVSFSSSQNR